jgi:hypothetical protein
MSAEPCYLHQPGDVEDLARLERVVAMAQRAPEAMEAALDEIRRRRLYTVKGYPTFDSYVRGHLKLSVRAAYYSIGAATVRKLLPSDVNHGSLSARALRPMLPLLDLRHDEPTPGERQDVERAWRLAQEIAARDTNSERRNEQPTARELKAAVAHVQGRQPEAREHAVDDVARRVWKAVDAARRTLDALACDALAERLASFVDGLRSPDGFAHDLAERYGVSPEEIVRNARVASVVDILKTILPDAEQRFVNGDEAMQAAVYRLAHVDRRARREQ